MKVLYISWDGAAQNYMESLFLPIFARLVEAGVEVHVLQFTWASAEQVASTREAAAQVGVRYEARGIWRSLGLAGVAGTILRGAGSVTRYARRHGIDVLMPRSNMAGAMALLARRRLPGVRLVFDADGLPADERREYRGWSERHPVYRALRGLEAAAVRRAAAVITRTERAKRVLLERAGQDGADEKVHVVPNGKDGSHFTPGEEVDRAEVRRETGGEAGAPLLVYAGSLGPQYYPAEMLDLFAAVRARCPAARLVVLTGNGEVLRPLLAKREALASAVTVTRVAPREVPRYLAAADLGMALRKPSFSQQGVSAIKVAEYLLCGLPVVSTRGVGDLDEQLDERVGVSLGSFGEEAFEMVTEWLAEEVLPNRDGYRARCRARGLAVFELEACARGYQQALNGRHGTEAGEGVMVERSADVG